MRLAALALIGGVGLGMLPLAAGAAPFAAISESLVTSSVVPVAGGCGPGYHPERFRDRYGYWRSRCVPNYGYAPYDRRYYGPYGYGGWPEPRWGWRGY